MRVLSELTVFVAVLIRILNLVAAKSVAGDGGYRCMRIKGIVSVVLALLLTGCVSVPSSQDGWPQELPEQSYFENYYAASEGNLRLICVCNDLRICSACKSTVITCPFCSHVR